MSYDPPRTKIELAAPALFYQLQSMHAAVCEAVQLLGYGDNHSAGIVLRQALAVCKIDDALAPGYKRMHPGDYLEPKP